MLFDSIDFLIYAFIFFTVYFIIPRGLRVPAVLGASLFFYGYWNPYYLVLIISSTIIDYCCGITLKFKKRKLAVIISVVTNLSILGYFKYYNFFISNINELIGTQYLLHAFLLPVGISFYTFQTMSYTIDVYSGRIRPEENFLIFFSYVCFFPQLVAGPIEKGEHLLPQLRSLKEHDHSFNELIQRVEQAFPIILSGIFRKVFIADRLGLYANSVFSNLEQAASLSVFIGILCASFKVYCDFSAYSTVAIGLGKLFGIELTENFKRPFSKRYVYQSAKVWHITLYRFFNDYLFFPINKKTNKNRGRAFILFNILAIWSLSGLWHGSDFKFIIWGFSLGVFCVIGKTTEPFQEKISSSAQRLLTKLIPKRSARELINILHCFAVILACGFAASFFWSNSSKDGLYAILKVFQFQDGSIYFDSSENFYISIASLVFVFSIDYTKERFRITQEILNNRIVQVVSHYVMIIAILFFPGTFVPEPMVYFQF